MKLLLGLSWLCWLWVAASAGERQVQEADIRFKISNAGLPVNGTFSGLEATIQFDPAHLEQARIRASVPVSTINTGIALRDRDLQKPTYFDAARYPTITMESTSFQKTGPNQYEGLFKLTIKDVQREVKMPFTVSADHKFEGKMRLNRLDYHVGKKNLIMANNVDVTIRVKAAQAH
ncbi:YceI family protein [Hymenobacter humi]|uniref:YceI family protein n=1 Tax=Hymenobacter humi TaxID=1411620 RepID=A0ABW2UB50_9BACT